MTTAETLIRRADADPEDPVARARALAPLIWASRDKIEEERQLPEALVAAIAGAGLFRLWVPRSLGGAEADIATLLRVVEELARVDGATGWNVAVNAAVSLAAGHLPTHAAFQVFGRGVSTPIAGSLVQRGPVTATALEGGYRLTGRWGFASGSRHAGWLAVGAVVLEHGSPRLGADGAPELYLMIVPRADAEIIDTWRVGGLRGTGSHDIAVRDVFVPAARTFPLLTSLARETGPLYRFPIPSLLGVSLAPVATGIARAAIDALVSLASEKTPAGGRTLLRERPLVQTDVARAEALLRSARAFLFEAVAGAWQAAAAGELPLRERALLRLAATNATASAAQAVDLVYAAGGGSAIYTSSPLERCFRDIHTLTQHAAVAPASYEPAGRVLLGMEPGTARL